jgi:hypothetical protein
MIDIDSYGGRIGKIQWCNTWHELWGWAGFWDKNPGEKGHFTLWGIRPKPISHWVKTLEQLTND